MSIPALQWRSRVASIALSAALAWSTVALNGQDTTAGSVTIRGLQSFSENEARKTIKTQLTHIEEHGASGARADDAAYFLQSELRDRGYPGAQVDWTMPNGGQVILTVSEGRLFELENVVCKGNDRINDEGLYELMTSVTREQLELKIDDPLPYVIQDLETGRKRVIEYYQLLGYLDAEAILTLPDIAASGSARRLPVELSIDEGKVYRVGSLDLPPPPEEGLSDEFEAIRNDYIDQIYSPSIPAQIQIRIHQAATDAGYVAAKASVVASEPVDQTDHLLVNLSCSAEFGPKYRIRSIRVKGEEKVEARYFEKRFESIIGKPVDPEKISSTVSDALASGAFRRVSVTPQLVEGDSAELDLEIDIEEVKRQELGLFGGYGTYEGGIVGLEYRHLNLFGIVRRFDSRIEASQRGIIGQATYTNPWFLWSEWQASIGVFGKLRQHEGYEKLENGLRAEFEREFSDDNRITLFLQGSYVDITDADIVQPFLGDENYLDGFAGIALSRDRLDDATSPRKGYELLTSHSFSSSALGGDYDYLRSTAKIGYHLPIGPTTLHLAGRTGAIFDLGDNNAPLPIDLRFFGGGANSVRSFADRELGPTDPGGYPIGGEFYTIFNVEYEVPIVGPLSLAVFLDSGNLLNDSDDAGFDDMHYAGGVGLRLHSPLGPLRLDYGHNLNQGENEPSGAFHIGFGVAF